MNRLPAVWFLAIVQAAVTGMLLAFAYLVHTESPEIANVVVGAAVLHWLREGTYLGRQVNEQQRRNGNGHSGG